MTKFAILALAALALTACSPEPKTEPVDATPIPLEQDDPPAQAVSRVSMPVPRPPHVRWSSRHVADFSDCVVSELTYDGNRYLVIVGANRQWTPACAIIPVPQGPAA